MSGGNVWPATDVEFGLPLGDSPNPPVKTRYVLKLK